VNDSLLALRPEGLMKGKVGPTDAL
jgi:hypothetical protein